jgi:hypothetical protein
MTSPGKLVNVSASVTSWAQKSPGYPPEILQKTTKPTNIMKNKFAILSFMGFSCLLPCANGAALLIDLYAPSANPTSSTDWSNAGVTESLTGAAGGTFTSGIGTYNISGGIDSTLTGSSGAYTAETFSGNTMLNSYIYSLPGNSVTMTITGLANGSGVPNTLTGALGSMTGTFTLVANQDYKLYLFGAGAGNNQNTTFTVGGINKTTSASIIGTAADAGHFVTYDLTTPSDLTGYTLPISFTGGSGSYGALNGLALVQVPEPSAALLGGLGMLALLRRRR